MIYKYKVNMAVKLPFERTHQMAVKLPFERTHQELPHSTMPSESQHALLQFTPPPLSPPTLFLSPSLPLPPLFVLVVTLTNALSLGVFVFLDGLPPNRRIVTLSSLMAYLPINHMVDELNPVVIKCHLSIYLSLSLRLCRHPNRHLISWRFCFCRWLASKPVPYLPIYLKVDELDPVVIKWQLFEEHCKYPWL
jgi:hypothetical protein